MCIWYLETKAYELIYCDNRHTYINSSLIQYILFGKYIITFGKVLFESYIIKHSYASIFNCICVSPKSIWHCFSVRSLQSRLVRPFMPITSECFVASLLPNDKFVVVF